MQQTTILEVFRQGLFQYRFYLSLINATIWVKQYLSIFLFLSYYVLTKVYAIKLRSIISLIQLYCTVGLVQGVSTWGSRPTQAL